ncbi:MAG TPA: polysaccharide deacetylase family protein [Chthonomonadaceae bacterium]|nr:polysaccharide deacetylase family protein [Chthonomonadaceae bacterium]
MRVRGLGRVRRSALWLRNRLAPGTLILRYHRVTDLPCDPYEQAVTPSHFAEHLEVLRKECCPLPLQDLLQAVQQGRVPRRAVAVTLDDGYADNLHNAKPLLERYAIPATVFVATGNLGTRREFWWDELERLLLHPGSLPPTLCLKARGRRYQWDLGASADFGAEDWHGYRRWRMFATEETPGPRPRLMRDLHALLRALPDAAQQEILQQVRDWAGVDATGRETHRALTPAELIRLADGGLVEIGGHTVTHPALPALLAQAQRDEIQQGKARLEEILGCPVVSFAYPQGDYGPETIAAVREAGFRCACTTCAEAVRRPCDPYLLPRVWPRDWDGDTFARHIRNWFHQ